MYHDEQDVRVRIESERWTHGIKSVCDPQPNPEKSTHAGENYKTFYGDLLVIS